MMKRKFRFKCKTLIVTRKTGTRKTGTGSHLSSVPVPAFRVRVPFSTRLYHLFAITAILCIFCGHARAIEKSNIPPISPDWVFDHWVWEDDVNTQQAVFELVDGYTSRGIPVGAVIIDSPWSTEYNNFVWNTANYPDPQGMIDALHRRGIKVILWMTSVLNETSDGGNFEPTTNEIYKEARDKGYLASDGRLTKWWKGEGGYIDYTNPEAVEWWHGLMDRVLLMGTDGWKIDGTGIMFPTDGYGMGDPADPNRKPIPMSGKEYKDLYYMDTYEHLLTRNPNGTIIARPVDLRLVAPGGYAPISHSPSNWVGDEHHDWSSEGFLEALQDIFDSARLGYPVIGSDTAGYHGDMPITKNLLIRWAQFSALGPFFENGGHGAHQPWLHDEETLNIYRDFVLLHLSLKPYLYSMMMQSHLGNGPIIHPQKGKWQYMLGNSLFVSVIFEDTMGREVTFPKGEWIDFWDNTKTYKGGETIYYDAPLDRYPLFIRKGAIIPLYSVIHEAVASGKIFSDVITIDIYPGGNRHFDLYEPGREKVNIDVDSTDELISIRVSPANGRKFRFRVAMPDKASAFNLKGIKPDSFNKIYGNMSMFDGKMYIEPDGSDTAGIDEIEMEITFGD